MVAIKSPFEQFLASIRARKERFPLSSSRLAEAEHISSTRLSWLTRHHLVGATGSAVRPCLLSLAKSLSHHLEFRNRIMTANSWAEYQQIRNHWRSEIEQEGWTNVPHQLRSSVGARLIPALGAAIRYDGAGTARIADVEAILDQIDEVDAYISREKPLPPYHAPLPPPVHPVDLEIEVTKNERLPPQSRKTATTPGEQVKGTTARSALFGVVQQPAGIHPQSAVLHAGVRDRA